jgi:2,4-dienoyl-CoA reductase-like NADH-dependent reductase (Old Yellow Enzyme family)
MKAGLFSQLNLPDRILKNRVIADLPTSMLLDENGKISSRMVDYYERIAACEVAMIITEPFAVNQEKFAASQPTADDPEIVSALSRITERIRIHSATPILQLTHPGFNASGPVDKIAFGPSPFKHSAIKHKIDPLSKNQIQKIIRSFIEAAISGWNAGFSGILINGADGGLIQQFLSPLSNNRSDAYSYDKNKGEKLALEIINAISKALPDFFIIFKLSSRDLLPGGRTLSSNLELAEKLFKNGVDAIELNSGFPIGLFDYSDSPTGKYAPEAPFSQDSHIFKQSLQQPVFLSGKISRPQVATEIIDNQIADAVVLGRSLNRDPEWLKKARLDSESIKTRICKRCKICSAASKGCPDMKGMTLWEINLNKYLIGR